MATGGYEFETCDKMGEHFKCVICTWILRDAMVLPCPHTFCRSCLIQWQETRNVVPYKCPTCNQTYEESQLQLNRSVDLIIRAKLDVFCKKHDIGCDWTGTIDEYDLHTNRDCTCADVQCQNIGCTVVFLRKNQKFHASNCPMRLVPCQSCNTMIIFSTLETHYKTCEMIDITCSNDGCDEKFKKKDLDKHQENCGFQIINCVYKDIGCMVKLKKIEMDKHIKNSFEHFALMHQEYCAMKAESISTRKQLNETEQRLNENIKELKETKKKLSQLEEQCEVIQSKLEISLNERNVEKCIVQLKWFNGNVDNYESLFKKLLYVMESDTRYMINGSLYYKVNIHERWQEGLLTVFVVDGWTFDYLKTDDNTVHHNNNVCVCVFDVHVVIDLLVEEGLTGDNTRPYILNPKLHEKVDCSYVDKSKYRDCLVDGFILLQLCRL